MDNQLPPADHTFPKPLAEKDLPAPHDMLLPPPHFTHKNSWMHWMPAIIGLIIGLFVGGSFLGGAINQTKPYTDSPSAALNTLFSPSSQPDNVSNWKTYANPNISYSFKYPANAIVNEDNMIILQMSGPTQKSNTSFNDGITLQFSLPFFVSTGLKEYVEEQKSNMNQVILNPIQEIQIGGTKAYTFTRQGKVPLRYIYLENPYVIHNFIYIIDASQDPTNQGFTDTVNKILATFQFTNPSTTGTPSIPISGESKACTDEAKVCSDGSYVGRTGPNCEFTPCPASQ